MKHIVFNEPDLSILQQAIALDETMQGELVLIRDDYAVGPIDEVYTATGRAVRQAWWTAMYAAQEHPMPEVDDYQTVAELVGSMRRQPEEIVWIWMAQNKHDVSGYYWLLKFMREFQGRVMVLYLNNLPFINDQGSIFYPKWLSEIPPREFLKAKRLARPITLSEFEIDPDEWLRLCREQKEVRLLEGGKKLIQEGADFYDAALSRYVTGDWQKVARVVHSFLQKEKETTGDSFLYWRLGSLLAEAGWELRNQQKGIRHADIRNPAIPAQRGQAKQDSSMTTTEAE